MSGNVMVAVRRPDNDIPVEYLADIRDGDYAYWKYYDFTDTKVNHFVCKTWDRNKAAQIEIRLDSPEGELIGTCDITQWKVKQLMLFTKQILNQLRENMHWYLCLRLLILLLKGWI